MTRTRTRRQFLEALAVASAAAATGCTAAGGAPGTQPSGRAPRPAPLPSRARAMPDPGLISATPMDRLHWETRDPFLFCAHHDDHYPRGDARLGPAASLSGREIGSDFGNLDGWSMYHGEIVPGFPEHPHRGFETVTVVRRGLLDHSDSMGATARYGQGDVQWLTAGSGIQHAEMFPLVHDDEPNPVELFQIWVNLPRADKMVAPHFSMLWADTIPRRTERDADGRATELTLVAGAIESRELEVRPPAPPPASYASREASDLAIWTVRMEPGARFVLPAARPGTNRDAYFHVGRTLQVDGHEVAVGHRLVLHPERAVELWNGPETSELLVLGARPIGEPIARRGPFVMSTREEIAQAYADFQRTRFGGWPWDRRDPVHPREEGRFARRPDGTIERPT